MVEINKLQEGLKVVKNCRDSLEKLEIPFSYKLKEIEKKNPPKNKENWPIKYGSYFSKAVDYYDHFVSMPVTVAVSELKFEVERRGIINDCKRV